MNQLKFFIIKMWTIVIEQVNRSKLATLNYDKNVIMEVFSNEKRIDSFELKIDMDIEDILKNGTSDIKNILSISKINYNLERIGDYAYFISNLIKDSNYQISEEVINKTKLNVMFDISIEMLNKSLLIYQNNDKDKFHEIFKLEGDMNDIHKISTRYIYEILETKNDVEQYLNTLLIINKLERLGDHIMNIMEEIISCVESKVLKHQNLESPLLFNTKDENQIIEIDDILIDKNKYTVNKNGTIYNLPKKEFELFCLLTSDIDKVFTREQILSNLWGDEVVVDKRTIDVHIRKIREKLNINNIVSIKGVGYKYSLINS